MACKIKTFIKRYLKGDKWYRNVPSYSYGKFIVQKYISGLEGDFKVLFHGSDWKGSEMYNRMIEDFKEVGVNVVFLPHTEGVSSTLLADVLYKNAGME